jgi:hypothetical protein
MRSSVLPLLLILGPAVAHADDPVLHVDASVDDCEVRFAPELTQAAYHRFAREFGSVSAYKQMGAPGVIDRKGLSLGIEYMAFQVDEHAPAWNDTFVHPDATHWLGEDKRFPKLKLRVGVGRRTDVGAYYTMNPESNYGWLGIDVKHELLRQQPGMPVTLAVRGAYTKTLFVDDMDMHALSADVSAGHTFRYHITPYAGVGTDAVLARETSPMVTLDTEYNTVGRAFAGVELALRGLRIGAEAHYSEIPSGELQMAYVF